MNRCIPQTVTTTAAMDDFVDFLTTKMAETNTSQTALAKAIGVERKVINRICNKLVYPRLDVMAEIYKYFGQAEINITIKGE